MGHTGQRWSRAGGGDWAEGCLFTANEKAARKGLAPEPGGPGVRTPGPARNRPLKNASFVSGRVASSSPGPSQAGPELAGQGGSWSSKGCKGNTQREREKSVPQSPVCSQCVLSARRWGVGGPAGGPSPWSGSGHRAGSPSSSQQRWSAPCQSPSRLGHRMSLTSRVPTHWLSLASIPSLSPGAETGAGTGVGAAALPPAVPSSLPPCSLMGGGREWRGAGSIGEGQAQEPLSFKEGVR